MTSAGEEHLMCASRFHSRLTGQVNSTARIEYQYVCAACRDIWLGYGRIPQEDYDMGGTQAIGSEINVDRLFMALYDEADMLQSLSPPSHESQEDDNSDSCTMDDQFMFLDSDCCGMPHLKHELELDATGDCPRECKKQKKDISFEFPAEIRSMIFSRAMDSEPRCALDLLVPDWHVCKRHNPLLEEALEITRVVTYTRGLGDRRGTLSTNFGHGEEDHIWLPMKTLDDRLLTLDSWTREEAIRSFFLEGTHVFGLSADCFFFDGEVRDMFDNDDADVFILRGKHMVDILPFSDEVFEAPKKTLPSGSLHVHQFLRHLVIQSPLRLMELESESLVGPFTSLSQHYLDVLTDTIDMDRDSPLVLSWSLMPKLESLLLDLRTYSHDANTENEWMPKDLIIRRAEIMGEFLQLKLLVLAGLQSYSFETSYKSYDAKRIEEDDEIDGEPNWIKIFTPAMRPGGQIVLVDRLMDGVPRLPPVIDGSVMAL
ncbi:hypothetical protein M426DRAFT_10592 [Hypoxylon sp. CI-4A]|nr:hypothetical protein M426DRAFT_10592 [Hypoxylon sp. CI-4A]